MNILLTSLIVAECFLNPCADIIAESSVKDAIICEFESEVLIALLLEPIIFKSEADGVEKRVRLTAAAYYNKTVIITRDSGTYYKLKNCRGDQKKEISVLQSVKSR